MQLARLRASHPRGVAALKLVGEGCLFTLCKSHSSHAIVYVNSGWSIKRSPLSALRRLLRGLWQSVSLLMCVVVQEGTRYLVRIECCLFPMSSGGGSLSVSLCFCGLLCWRRVALLILTFLPQQATTSSTAHQAFSSRAMLLFCERFPSAVDFRTTKQGWSSAFASHQHGAVKGS